MTQDDVDRAITQMKEQLARSNRDPRLARIEGQNDQLGAQLRDMDDDQWNAAVIETMSETGLSEEEVRNWFGRLSGKCDPDDAQWTGVEGLDP